MRTKYARSMRMHFLHHSLSLGRDMTRRYYYIACIAFTSKTVQVFRPRLMLSCIYNELCQGSIFSAGFRRWSKYMGWFCSSLSGGSGLRNFCIFSSNRSTATCGVRCYT